MYKECNDMNTYTFKHKGETIKVEAMHWRSAMQLVQDQEDVALEPDGYWRDSSYEERVYTWITKGKAQ